MQCSCKIALAVNPQHTSTSVEGLHQFGRRPTPGHPPPFPVPGRAPGALPRSCAGHRCTRRSRRAAPPPGSAAPSRRRCCSSRSAGRPSGTETRIGARLFLLKIQETVCIGHIEVVGCFSQEVVFYLFLLLSRRPSFLHVLSVLCFTSMYMAMGGFPSLQAALRKL